MFHATFIISKKWSGVCGFYALVCVCVCVCVCLTKGCFTNENNLFKFRMKVMLQNKTLLS
jgi:hypothetical protein